MFMKRRQARQMRQSMQLSQHNVEKAKFDKYQHEKSQRELQITLDRKEIKTKEKLIKKYAMLEQAMI